jgi:hypothetical protein
VLQGPPSETFVLAGRATSLLNASLNSFSRSFVISLATAIAFVCYEARQASGSLFGPEQRHLPTDPSVMNLGLRAASAPHSGYAPRDEDSIEGAHTFSIAYVQPCIRTKTRTRCDSCMTANMFQERQCGATPFNVCSKGQLQQQWWAASKLRHHRH